MSFGLSSEASLLLPVLFHAPDFFAGEERKWLVLLSIEEEVENVLNSSARLFKKSVIIFNFISQCCNKGYGTIGINTE